MARDWLITPMEQVKSQMKNHPFYVTLCTCKGITDV